MATLTQLKVKLAARALPGRNQQGKPWRNVAGKAEAQLADLTARHGEVDVSDAIASVPIDYVPNMLMSMAIHLDHGGAVTTEEAMAESEAADARAAARERRQTELRAELERAEQEIADLEGVIEDLEAKGKTEAATKRRRQLMQWHTRRDELKAEGAA